MSTAARFVCPFVVCPSLQVSVFQVPVLKGKALLLPLAPFLIVKVNVSALEGEYKRSHIKSSVCNTTREREVGVQTCSNSSVIVLGSSCLWNHIMYLVWNLHDCFFRALAARYWALVPCGGEGGC